MEKIFEHILSPDDRLIKYGQLNEKVAMELKMMTSLYEFMEIVTNYYDDEDRPFVNNWTDIEGMGYGWAWLRHEEKDWHKMMSRLVGDEADYLMRNMEDILYFVYENKRANVYHFVCIDGLYRKDVIISFSNKELDPFY